MVQSNITTYLTPEKEAKSFGVTQISSQFLDPNPPVDVFIQTCSFSTRIFFDVNYICLYLFNLEKVSLLDCQLTGQFSPKCNSLTLFGCYLLAVGPKDPVTNQEYPPNTTTPGITWSPPETPGYPKSSRFIQSSCEYVGMTNKWKDSKGKLVEINDYNRVCQFLKKNVNTPNTNNYKITQNVLPWNTSQWKGLKPSVFFSNISFYMVNTDTTINASQNHFNLINLTNSLGTCQFGDTSNNTVIFRGTN